LSPYNVLLVALSDDATEMLKPHAWKAISAYDLGSNAFIGTNFSTNIGGSTFVQLGDINLYSIVPTGPISDGYAKNYMYAQTTLNTPTSPTTVDPTLPISYVTINQAMYKFAVYNRSSVNGCSSGLTMEGVDQDNNGMVPDWKNGPGNVRFYQTCPSRLSQSITVTGFAREFAPVDRVEMAQISTLTKDPAQWLLPVVSSSVSGDLATNKVMPFVEMEVWQPNISSHVSFVYPSLPVLTNLEPNKHAAARFMMPSFDPLHAPLSQSGPGQPALATAVDIGVDRPGNIVVLAYERGEIHYMSGPHLAKFHRVANNQNPYTVNADSIRSISVVPNATMFGPELNGLTSTTLPAPPPMLVEQPITCLQTPIFTRASSDTNGHMPLVGDSRFFAIEDSDVAKITRTGEHVATFQLPGAGGSVITPHRQGTTASPANYKFLVTIDLRCRWNAAEDGIIGTLPNCELRYERVAADGTVLTQILAKNCFSHAGATAYGGHKRISTVVDFSSFATNDAFRFSLDLSGDANLFDRYTCEYRMIAIDQSYTNNLLYWQNRSGLNTVVDNATDQNNAGLPPVRQNLMFSMPGNIDPAKMLFFVGVDIQTPPNTTGVPQVVFVTAELVDHIGGTVLGTSQIRIQLRETLANTPTKENYLIPIVVDPTLPGVTLGTPYQDYRIDIRTSRSALAGDPRTPAVAQFELSGLVWRFDQPSGGTDGMTGRRIDIMGSNMPTHTNVTPHTKKSVATSTNACPAIAAAWSPKMLLWAPDASSPPLATFGNLVLDDSGERELRSRLSGLYTNTNSKWLWAGYGDATVQTWIGIYSVSIPQYIAQTTTTTVGTTTTAAPGTWTGNWVYAARRFSIAAFKDTETASILLSNDEEGYGIAVADGPRVYFTTITAANTTRLYWAPLDLSTRTMLATYPNSRVTDLAWDWNQKKLVLQDELGRRIFMTDHNSSPAGVVADADTPPYLQRVFGHMEVNPKSSLLYHNANWGDPHIALELGQPTLAYQDRHPSLIDLSKTIDSLPPAVTGDNAFHQRLFVSANVFAANKECLISPVASAFRPLRDMEILPDPTTTLPGSTTSTTAGSTTTGTGSTTTSTTGGSTTTTTTGTGSTTTGTGTSTTGGSTTTTVATTTTPLGTTTGDPGCWTVTPGVEIYPTSGNVRVNQDPAQIREIWQLVNQVPATQVVLSIEFTAIVADTYMYFASATGSILKELKIDAPGTYRLKYTPTAISNLRVGVRVTAGPSGTYTQFRTASLRACNG
jgi:hypothetical protein